MILGIFLIAWLWFVLRWAGREMGCADESGPEL